METMDHIHEDDRKKRRVRFEENVGVDAPEENQKYAAGILGIPETSQQSHQKHHEEIRQFEIRRNIQLPKPPRRQRKRTSWVVVPEKSEFRLYFAFLILIVGFFITFTCYGIGITVRKSATLFLKDAWKVGLAAALITCIVALYVCWEESFPKPQQRRQKVTDEDALDHIKKEPCRNVSDLDSPCSKK